MGQEGADYLREVTKIALQKTRENNTHTASFQKKG